MSRGPCSRYGLIYPGGKTGVRHGGDTHQPKWPPSSIFMCKSKVSPLPMSFDENRVWSIHWRPGCEPLNPSGEDSGLIGLREYVTSL